MLQRLFVVLTAGGLLIDHAGLVVDAYGEDVLPAGTLTNAAQIHNLTPGQAAQAIPVRLRVVVVDESAPREFALLAADETAGVYVSARANIFAPFHRRDVLEIEGVTSKGQYAPCVIATLATKVDWTNPPAARPATYQQLASGTMDAQLVEISGVVRQCWPAAPGDSNWRLVMTVDGNPVMVWIPVPQDPLVQVDTEVLVRAVCLYQFNQKRQALNPILVIPRGDTVDILKDPPSDPYSAPIRPSASLLQYSPDVSPGHRIHVRGKVTHVQPAARVHGQSTGAQSIFSGSNEESDTIWIRDESTGLRIQAHGPADLQPGDVIEALGFPGRIFANPVLDGASVRKIETSLPCAPLILSNLSQAFECQDDLVSIEARLTDLQPTIDSLVLILESGNKMFKSFLKLPLDSNRQPAWQPGSLVRVTGICMVTYDSLQAEVGYWHPQSFQILIRSPADLSVIQSPPWWTTRHIMFLLGIITGGLFLFSGAVMWLARRRLHEQKQRRAMAEAQFAAVITERNRLAREIHDTLAQGLAATSVQLQLAEIKLQGDSMPASQHLEKAQILVRDSLEEARNSIWNMRPQVLETGDLVSALRNILEKLSEGIVAQTEFNVAGRARRLPAIIENNVLRLGQEAVTNAVNHAQAKHITVTMDFGEKVFLLTVVDDGRGFDPVNPPPSEGGFGLVGMQDRAKDSKGTLTIRSALNQGTEIQLNIPLQGE